MGMEVGGRTFFLLLLGEDTGDGAGAATAGHLDFEEVGSGGHFYSFFNRLALCFRFR